MDRRTWLKDSASAAVAWNGAAPLFAEPRRSTILELPPGPQLFLDDFVIETLDGVVRRVHEPQRIDRPVLDSKTFGVTQPYLSVLRDPSSGLLRLWYNHRSDVWLAESKDGVKWSKPQAAWKLGHAYGCAVVDDGPGGKDATRRFKMANWQATREKEDKPGDDGGMAVGFSPNGVAWTPHRGNPVLPTWPAGWPHFVRDGVGDTVDVFRDDLLGRYVAAVKVHAVKEDGLAPGPKAGKAIRRLVGLTTSEDFIHWERPRRIFVPDQNDDGLLEFYGMGGMHRQGSLRIGFVRVLRDDLPCDPGGPVNGIGYTALAFSRDGLTWQRTREPFLPRNPTPGSWDHAMTWTGGVLPVGDELYLYYGGYARGHKIAPESERQIGLSRMKRDRYLSLRPSQEEGVVRTRLFRWPGKPLHVNVHAPNGRLDIRLLDADGRARDGGDTRSLDGDHLAAEAVFKETPRSLVGKPVRIEFRLRRADLFAFEFHEKA